MPLTDTLQTAYVGGNPTGIATTNRTAGDTDTEFIETHMTGAFAAAPRGTHTLTTTVNCVGGGGETVQTVKDPGETYFAFWDRHEQAVKNAAADCP